MKMNNTSKAIEMSHKEMILGVLINQYFTIRSEANSQHTVGNDETTIILPIAIAGIGISFSFLWFGDINIIWNMVFVSVPLFCLIIICRSVSAHEKSAYLNGWMVALSDAINQLIGLENDCMLNYNFNSYENTIDFIEKVRDHSSKKRTDVSYLPYIETMLANLLPTAIALIIYCLFRFKNM